MARILIADDDPILRATVCEYLGAVGHEVIEALDGEEALALVRARPVDLVILDMLMPNKDGLETILELRRTGSTVPILAISSGGKMDKSVLLRPALVFGASRTLAKPLLRETLIQMVAGLLADPVAAFTGVAPAQVLDP